MLNTKRMAWPFRCSAPGWQEKVVRQILREVECLPIHTSFPHSGNATYGLNVELDWGHSRSQLADNVN